MFRMTAASGGVLLTGPVARERVVTIWGGCDDVMSAHSRSVSVQLRVRDWGLLLHLRQWVCGPQPLPPGHVSHSGADIRIPVWWRNKEKRSSFQQLFQATSAVVGGAPLCQNAAMTLMDAKQMRWEDLLGLFYIYRFVIQDCNDGHECVGEGTNRRCLDIDECTDLRWWWHWWWLHTWCLPQVLSRHAGPLRHTHGVHQQPGLLVLSLRHWIPGLCGRGGLRWHQRVHWLQLGILGRVSTDHHMHENTPIHHH